MKKEAVERLAMELYPDLLAHGREYQRIAFCDGHERGTKTEHARLIKLLGIIGWRDAANALERADR